MAKVIELHFFGGLTYAETSIALGLSEAPDSFRNALDAAVALELEARRLDGIYLTTAPHSLPSLDGTDKTSLPVA